MCDRITEKLAEYKKTETLNAMHYCRDSVFGYSNVSTKDCKLRNGVNRTAGRRRKLRIRMSSTPGSRKSYRDR